MALRITVKPGNALIKLELTSKAAFTDVSQQRRDGVKPYPATFLLTVATKRPGSGPYCSGLPVSRNV